jgi:hypothetical protein
VGSHRLTNGVRSAHDAALLRLAGMLLLEQHDVRV